MLTLQISNKIVDAVLKKAEELNQKVSVAVVDNNGLLVNFRKMEGAFPVSHTFAIAKAYTSGTLGMPTKDMEPYAVPGKPYYGIESLAGGEFTTIAGGLPIKDVDGKVIGGIGVGGSYDVLQDVECAEAGINAQ